MVSKITAGSPIVETTINQVQGLIGLGPIKDECRNEYTKMVM